MAEQLVSLPKDKDDKACTKRWNIDIVDVEDDDSVPVVYDKQSLNLIIAQARNPDPDIQLNAVTQARKILSNKNAPIDDFIEGGLLPILVECLRSANADLQSEAAWALTNITAGTSQNVEAVAVAGAIPPLLELLQSPSLNVCDQAIWAIANIIGENPQFRDYCLQLGIIPPLLSFIVPGIPLILMRNITWLLANICISTVSPPPREILIALLPVFAALINHQDITVVANSLQALANVANGGEKQIEMLFECNDASVVKNIIPFLNSSDVKILIVALQTLSNITYGTNEQTQALLDYGVLKFMKKMVMHRADRVFRLAMLILSNITAGTETQIQAVFETDLLHLIFHLLQYGNLESQKESVWICGNIINYGAPEHALLMVDKNVIPAFCDLLVWHDPQAIQTILDSLHSILEKAGNRVQEICQKIAECGGVDKIKLLQNHTFKDISQSASHIISLISSSTNSSSDNSGTNDGDLNETQQPLGFNFY